ncbi:ABC transporter permease [Paenibacillus sp. GCM10027626]|uniref:fluoroquinolone export ABC transporter permease subunit n=1 Tax=Paenibacillus sp. GCM10027626 TaxID=3273411 RepID=UPI003643FA6B
MRFVSALGYDMKLQARHGFYYAYLIISILYIILLQALPGEYRQLTGIILTFSDPSALGFFFIGGLVLLEKGQGIHDSLFVTPYTTSEYIWSKTLSLMLLSLLTSTVIHLSAFGLSAGSSLLPFWAGVGLTSIFFTLIGLGVAAGCQTLNGFFLQSMLVTAVFYLPLLEIVGVYDRLHLLYAVLPTHATLLLLKSPFEPVSNLTLLYAMLQLGAWIALAYLWTRRMFTRAVILKIGKGEG